jgi:Transposase DDE domain group 1
MPTACQEQFTLWDIGSQEVRVGFDGGRVVADAGLLSLRAFDKKLDLVADLARRLPDPRSQDQCTYSCADLLAQRVYQILAGYPDARDAHTLRTDPLFQTLLDVSPADAEATLASPSTLNRFQYAYTRRQAQLPAEERPVLLEQPTARNQRLRIFNDYLVELFVRTRRQPPRYVIVDLDATDDPTHGQQILSLFHGYYDQYQYFPLLAFDGETGLPLAAWLRPGVLHASCGATEILADIVTSLRQAWPGLTIVVRGDNGLAVPEMYDYCEREGLLYTFGYATNAVLKRATDTTLAALEQAYGRFGQAADTWQHFEAIEDYRADSWPWPRRLVVKLEVNRHGTNRRFVVTNLCGAPQGIYQGFYVQRGDVPESPIGELKKGLQADRLSAHGFRANALLLLEHVLAYALIALYRQAAAPAVPELATAEISTWRQRLWKVGAVVTTSVRKIWFHMSETWPYAGLWQRAHIAALAWAERVAVATAVAAVVGATIVPEAPPLLLK